MKRLAIALFAPALSAAGTQVFEGYEAYYATLQGTLFKAEDAIQLDAQPSPSGASVNLKWRGKVGGRVTRSVEIGNGVLVIDQQQPIRTTRAFPGETISAGDLGRGTVAYFTSGWTCIENTPSSASGTAVRHKAVYLIRTGSRQAASWKLPSLFASCTNVRLDMEQIRFDKAEYRYKAGQDFPVGVLFREHLIGPNNEFAPTGQERSASFVEPENVYRFSVDER